jgi:hypothetical protein
VKKGEENLSIKSLADGEFYLNQWEYFTGEIVRKLMNPSYTMNYKDAPLYENLDDFNYTTVKDLKEIKLPEIKGNTLDIVKRLKEITIADADTAYQKKDYLLSLNGFRDARDALNSLSPEDKKKAGNMATDIQNRIYMVGDAMFAVRLGELETYYKENSSMSLKAVNKRKGLDGWLYLFTDYQKTLEDGERNPVTEKRIAKRILDLAERRYRLLMEEEEKSGDEKLAKGKYDCAISYYLDALDVLKISQGLLGDKEKVILEKKITETKAKLWNPEMEKIYIKSGKKLEYLWNNANFESYTQTLNDTRDSLNDIQLKGGNRSDLVLATEKKIKDYPEKLKQYELEIQEKISLYTDAAKVDSSYNKKLKKELEREGYLYKEAQVLLLPQSFKTRTNIKFFKILKKDGKPIYISERLRPDKKDSWYFARDFAKILNEEDNCPDCYRLPSFDEIENLEAEIAEEKESNKIYEGLWLKSWSFAPLGMTYGNLIFGGIAFPFYIATSNPGRIIFFGVYTMDYFHDIVLHPLTWQSYLYPISPDSAVSKSGYTWDRGGRISRTFNRFSFDDSGSNGEGFRLVRPLP